VICACPDTLKGVLSAADAAAALARGLRAGGAEAVALPVADGGEGTLDAVAAARGGAWRDVETVDAFGVPRTARWLELDEGTALVEAAEAIPLDPRRLDPLAASSRGLGLVLTAVGRPRRLVVGLGGTANVDGGAGLLDVVDELPAPTTAACDVGAPLLDAARVFAAQKGAGPADAAELERRLRVDARLAPWAEEPGAGAAGGLGAALASLGAELRPGAEVVLDLLRFDPGAYELVVTGEGTVDATTALGKAPAAVARRCAAVGVPCVVFGGRVVEPLDGVRTVALSGDPARALEDLVELGERLARELGVSRRP
jgi:glycerate kinase